MIRIHIFLINHTAQLVEPTLTPTNRVEHALAGYYTECPEMCVIHLVAMHYLGLLLSFLIT